MGARSGARGRTRSPPHRVLRREGVRFVFYTTPGEIEPLVELVEEGSRLQFGDSAFVEELIRWIRFNRREIEVMDTPGASHFGAILAPVGATSDRPGVLPVLFRASNVMPVARRLRAVAARSTQGAVTFLFSPARPDLAALLPGARVGGRFVVNLEGATKGMGPPYRHRGTTTVSARSPENMTCRLAQTSTAARSTIR